MGTAVTPGNGLLAADAVNPGKRSWLGTCGACAKAQTACESETDKQEVPQYGGHRLPHSTMRPTALFLLLGVAEL